VSLKYDISEAAANMALLCDSFSQNGLDSNMSAILAGVLSMCLTIGTIPAIILIDRVGRRGLMLWSAVIMSVIMTVFVSL